MIVSPRISHLTSFNFAFCLSDPDFDIQHRKYDMWKDEDLKAEGNLNSSWSGSLSFYISPAFALPDPSTGISAKAPRLVRITCMSRHDQ